MAVAVDLESLKDWDKGLPPDVLALVAKAGGLPDMKSMRGVSKTWHEGFELGVSGIRVSFKDPLLPVGGIASRRFPLLTSLVIGASSADESWLQTLRAFPKLNNLHIGHILNAPTAPWPSPLSLTYRLSDAGLGFICGLPIARLDLSTCRQLTPGGITKVLRGMPLTSLSLRKIATMTDAGLVSLESLQGKPLRFLDLCQYGRITDAGLGFLRGAPLEFLDLESARVTDTGLEILCGMPLTRLNLAYCRRLTPGGLSCLRGMPLTSLVISCCPELISDATVRELRGLPLRELSCEVDMETEEGSDTELTDAGMDLLSRFPLTSLSIRGCLGVTVGGLQKLRKLPLTRLSLSDCDWVGDAALEALRGLPLRDLDVCGCEEITDEGLKHLAEMPLSHLNFCGCPRITGHGLQHLVQMPLTKLSVAGFCPWLTHGGLKSLQGMKSHMALSLPVRKGLTDADLWMLQGLPLSSLNISGCHFATLEHLKGLPIADLNLVACTQLVDACVEILRGLPLTSLSVSLFSYEHLTDDALEALRELATSAI